MLSWGQAVYRRGVPD